MDAAAESTAIPPRRGFGRSNSHEPSQLRPWEAHAHVAADGCSAATRKWTKKKKTSCAAHVNTPRRRWNGSAPEPRSVPTCSGRPPWRWKPCDKHVHSHVCGEMRTSYVAFRRSLLHPSLVDAFATKAKERNNTTSWHTRASLLRGPKARLRIASKRCRRTRSGVGVAKKAMPSRARRQVHLQTQESWQRVPPLLPMLWQLQEDVLVCVCLLLQHDASINGQQDPFHQGATRASWFLQQRRAPRVPSFHFFQCNAPVRLALSNLTSMP